MAAGRFVGAHVAAAGHGREPLRGHRSGALSADETGSATFIWLRADRGLLSRANEVGVVGSSGSGAPAVAVRFTSPGRLVVTYQGEIVSRIRFDPHDLEMIDTECHTLTSPPGPTITSCLGDPAT